MNDGFSTYPGARLPGRRKAGLLKKKLGLGELDGRFEPGDHSKRAGESVRVSTGGLMSEDIAHQPAYRLARKIKVSLYHLELAPLLPGSELSV